MTCGESTANTSPISSTFLPGALRCGAQKYLKKIIEEMDLIKRRRDYIAVETLFGNFTRDQNLRINKLRNLNVRARIFICEDNYYEF